MGGKVVMHEQKQKLDFSFGSITLTVGVDGRFERRDAAVDDMLATAVSVTSIGINKLGISELPQGQRSMSFDDMLKADQIALKLGLEFALKRGVPKSTINTLVVGVILPKFWQSAIKYVGDLETFITPQSPLANASLHDIEQQFSSIVKDFPSGPVPIGTRDYAGQQYPASSR